jgi:uncharacterized protein
MNAEERHLINDLFERLRAYGAVDKDLEAEQLIIANARSNPDAGYMLVQNVLVQEQVIAQQQQEIDGLKAELAQAQAQRGAAGGRSGGFLGGTAGGGGGMFGGARGSVPPTNVSPMPRQAPQPQYAPQPAPASPWGRSAQAQAPQAPVAPQAPAAAGGGGFMRSALGMAAGVAGGMLAANAISNMMRGNNDTGNQPASGGDVGNNDQGNYDASGDNYGYGNANEAASQEGYAEENNDPGTDSGSSFDSGSEEF